MPPAVVVLALALAAPDAVAPEASAPVPTIKATSPTPPATDPALRAKVRAVVDRMRARASSVETMSCTFHQTELVDGKLLPKNVIEQRTRKNGDVYMRWLEGPVAGRKLLYRPAENDGDMIVKQSFFPALSVDPRGMLARQGNRHLIMEAGVEKVALRVVADDLLLRTLPDDMARYVDLGPRTVAGRSAWCWRATTDKEREPRLYAHETELCVDDETAIPVIIRVWDRETGALRLVEDYAFLGCRIDTLGDQDFDPENPELGF